jgi:toxin YoeB
MAKSKQRKNREAVLHPEFIDDLQYWVKTDRRTALRALEIVEATVNDPCAGIGKPEPLKYLAPNTWSRRLTQEHRIVYLVKDDHVEFLQARYQYG